MTQDTSNGWNAIAAEFIKLRSGTGTDVIDLWIETLPSGCSVLDIGCGFGHPVTATLQRHGFDAYGIEPSEKLVEAFKQRLTDIPVACEPFESSTFFNRHFDAICAVGLIFLLSEVSQSALVEKVSAALNPGGQFLFSAPKEICEWQDSLTYQTSRSLGADAYIALGKQAGLSLRDTYLDAGQNHYFLMEKS